MNPLLAIAEGTVKRGDEIGFNKGSNRWRKYIWDTCDVCHKGRWVIFIHNGPKHTVCNSCSNKRDHGRIRNPLNPNPTFTKGDNGLFTGQTEQTCYCGVPFKGHRRCAGCNLLLGPGHENHGAHVGRIDVCEGNCENKLRAKGYLNPVSQKFRLYSSGLTEEVKLLEGVE